MAVVIRLQGLSVTAGSEDIRRFFTGLKIPDGGVHIIGGERDEAFIIFASDDCARRAMSRSGGIIKGSSVTLLLSSKAEMQNMLERSTKTMELNQNRQLVDNVRHVQRSAEPEFGRGPVGRMGNAPSSNYQMASNDDDCFYLFLKGLPFSVTEQEVCDFFGGILIVDILLLKNRNGSNNGKGLVKFSTREDADEGLKRDKEYIGSRYIEISPTTVDDWRRETDRMSLIPQMDDGFERGRSPFQMQMNPTPRMRSRSPVARRPTAPPDEFCVLLENLSFTVEKQHIKDFFHYAMLEDDQILHLLDSNGRRTRSAFVLFKNTRDYCDALSLEKRQFHDRWVDIRPISRANMVSLLGTHNEAVRPGVSERMQGRGPSYPRDGYDSECVCLFVLNLPFDVRKVEIMDFFHGFNVTEDRVWVLHDHKGAGVGKALVLFGSEAEAIRALHLNGQRFLGSEVLLKSISRSQMQELIAEPPAMHDLAPREDWSSARANDTYFQPEDSSYHDVRIHHNDNMADNVQRHNQQGAFEFKPYAARPRFPNGRGNGVSDTFDSSGLNFDGPTCVQLVNLPFQIKSHEIYDFCYGYHVIPGSVSLQYDPSGKPKGSATLVFGSRQEALTAIEELGGRPIGPRKIQLLLV